LFIVDMHAVNMHGRRLYVEFSTVTRSQNNYVFNKNNNNINNNDDDGHNN